MLGKQPGTLVTVRAVEIHGAKFYDVEFSLDASPGRVATSRLGQESVYLDPRSGDQVNLHLVLGQVTKIERR